MLTAVTRNPYTLHLLLQKGPRFGKPPKVLPRHGCRTSTSPQTAVNCKPHDKRAFFYTEVATQSCECP
ncbi:hypothetical protein MRX96_023492 [Rhipicephalus microplus]